VPWGKLKHLVSMSQTDKMPTTRIKTTNRLRLLWLLGILLEMDRDRECAKQLLTAGDNLCGVEFKVVLTPSPCTVKFFEKMKHTLFKSTF
jgi:hypothetical protein